MIPQELTRAEEALGSGRLTATWRSLEAIIEGTEVRVRACRTTIESYVLSDLLKGLTHLRDCFASSCESVPDQMAALALDGQS